MSAFTGTSSFSDLVDSWDSSVICRIAERTRFTDALNHSLLSKSNEVALYVISTGADNYRVQYFSGKVVSGTDGSVRKETLPMSIV